MFESGEFVIGVHTKDYQLNTPNELMAYNYTVEF